MPSFDISWKIEPAHNTFIVTPWHLVASSETKTVQQDFVFKTEVSAFHGTLPAEFNFLCNVHSFSKVCETLSFLQKIVVSLFKIKIIVYF